MGRGKDANGAAGRAIGRPVEDGGRRTMGSHASTWQQYRVLLGKDIRREFRTFDMLLSMFLYSVLVLIVFGAALTQAGSSLDIMKLSGGLLWVIIVFTSLLGLNRSFAYEKENACIEGLMLVTSDRSVIFLSKTTSNLLFLLLVEAVTVPLFYFFFLTGIGIGKTMLLIVFPIILGDIGMAGVGTMLSTMTVNTRGKDVILAILFIPLIFPMLYACVSATTAVILADGGFMTVYLRSLLLAGGYDVIMLLASWALYGFVVSA